MKILESRRFEERLRIIEELKLKSSVGHSIALQLEYEVVELPRNGALVFGLQIFEVLVDVGDLEERGPAPGGARLS